MKHHKNLVNLQEANLVLDPSDSKVMRHMLEYATTSLLIKNQTPSSDQPNEPFDVAFFLEIIKYMVRDENYIRKIIHGETEESEWGDL